MREMQNVGVIFNFSFNRNHQNILINGIYYNRSLDLLLVNLVLSP